MFVLSFKNGGGNDCTRNHFVTYYMPLVEIKDFHALNDNKLFSNQPVKNIQELYEKPVQMSQNDDCTTGNFLYFLYHQNCYKLFDIDLSRQSNTIPQQSNLTGKLEEDGDATMFFIIEKPQKIF